MSQSISHDGVVKSAHSNHISVQILQSSACGGCAAKSLCSSVESKERLIDVAVGDATAFHEGEAVTVIGKLSDGLNAAVLAYVVPLCLLVLVLVITQRMSGREEMAAIAGLLALVPYYGVLYLFRGSLQRRFSFVVEKKRTYQ